MSKGYYGQIGHSTFFHTPPYAKALTTGMTLRRNVNLSKLNDSTDKFNHKYKNTKYNKEPGHGGAEPISV